VFKASGNVKISGKVLEAGESDLNLGSKRYICERKILRAVITTKRCTRVVLKTICN